MMTSQQKSQQKVVVIGGGPVGALAALYTARRGYKVDLYDLRDDPNFGDPNKRPDIAVIPLALSHRGIEAIAGAGVPGLIDGLIDDSRPIHTRMVHTSNKDGELTDIPMPYGPNGEVLHTLPREKIAKRLLLELGNEPNATLKFNHKLTSCNFDTKVAKFEEVNWTEKSKGGAAESNKDAEDAAGNEPSAVDTKGTTEVQFDFIIGCDGAYSSLRQTMMRQQDMNFQQKYINALWCDFIIPPTDDNEYAIEAQNLHLWPDKESIIMAQPDFDGSFRGGMIAPADKCRYFEQHPEEFAAFFKSRYPGIVPELLSEESVTEQFVKHQHISLKSVYCGNFGYQDAAVLLGDSSHTMTPFHAMGMISGLEDVRVFFQEFIDKAHAENPYENRFCPPGVVKRYTEHRRPDVQAMTDMAAEHYDELRFGVKSRASRAKKHIETFLCKYAPWLDWTTLYARIQFGNERFSVLRKKEDQQKTIIKSVFPGIFLTGALVAATAIFYVH